MLYELHVGTFTAEGTFEAAIPYLRGLRQLGVTAIELMPIGEFPGGRGWGYDGVYISAAHSAYGGPPGLRRLVEPPPAMHVLLAEVAEVRDGAAEGCHAQPRGDGEDLHEPAHAARGRRSWTRAHEWLLTRAHGAVTFKSDRVS